MHGFTKYPAGKPNWAKWFNLTVLAVGLEVKAAALLDATIHMGVSLGTEYTLRD